MSARLKIAHARGDAECQGCDLLLGMANRHGLITGATGTGKTVTLQVLIEQFSRAGVPVFVADVKGDLSGIAAAGKSSPKLVERLANLGLTEPEFTAFPTVFWDTFGESGHPLRVTISDLGPLLLARILGLNETQTGVLSVVFKLADEQGLLLLDIKDLRALLQYVAENARTFSGEYGNVSTASVGAIQRSLLALDQQGGDLFIGEPMLDIDDLLQVEGSFGTVNVLAAERLLGAPKVYSTLLLWLLGNLYSRLPEVGDPEKPKLVFFFDEAHLLFDDAPKALLEKIEQVVRLIRSKGVGIYFVTQSPLDIPDGVLGQLGNRIHHALRAYTARDQKAVRAVAQTLRANPAIDTATAICELGVGEALISMLDPKGRPGVVERAFILTPGSRIGPLGAEERRACIERSPLQRIYGKTIDRESAYEMLLARAQSAQEAAADKDASRKGSGKGAAASSRDGIFEAMAKSAARSLGTSLGRQILGPGSRVVRDILGTLLGGGKKK